MELPGGTFAEPLPQLLSPRMLPRGPASNGNATSSSQGSSPRTGSRAVTSPLTSPMASPRNAAALRSSPAVVSPRAASPPRGQRGAGPDTSPPAGGATGERTGSIHDLRRPQTQGGNSSSSRSGRDRSDDSSEKAGEVVLAAPRASRRDVLSERGFAESEGHDRLGSPGRSRGEEDSEDVAASEPSPVAPPKSDDRRRQHRQLGRSFASAAQTLQHHLLMCLKMLGMMLEQYVDRKQQAPEAVSTRRKPNCGSQPSPRLPPSALGVNAEPPGIGWRLPANSDGNGTWSFVQTMDKGGNQFLLFVAMLDAMLRGSLFATQKAQTRCFDEFPETQGCQQDEFISFDGTLTTVYEDEDFETKRSRAEVPQEPGISGEEHRHLEAEYLRVKASISALQQRLGEDSARVLQLEETRRELRTELDQRQVGSEPVEVDATPEKEATKVPVPLEGLGGVVADCIDSRGAVLSEAELQKLAKSIRKLKSEAEELSGEMARAGERLKEANSRTDSWHRERSEMRKLLSLDAEGDDLFDAVKALVRRRNEFNALPPEPNTRIAAGTMSGGSKPSATLHTLSATGSAPSLRAATNRRANGLVVGRDPRREAIPSVQRGRRGGPAAGDTDAAEERDKEKLRELSNRFVEVQQQYRHYVSENKRLREVVSGPPAMSPTLAYSHGSRSEASLPTVAQVNTVGAEAARVRSLSMASRATASSDRSPDPSSGSGRDRSLDGSQSHSTDRSPDSWRSDESPLLEGLCRDGFNAGDGPIPSWPGLQATPASLAEDHGLIDVQLPSASLPSRPRSPLASVGSERGRRVVAGSDVYSGAAPGRGHVGARNAGALHVPQGLVPADARLGLGGSAVSAPSHSQGGAGQAPRSGREGGLQPSQRRDAHAARRPQDQQGVCSSHPSHLKPARRQGSFTVLPGDGAASGRTLPRSPADAKNAEAINNLVSIFRGSRLQDIDQQPAPEPVPEAGLPSPPAAASPPAARVASSGTMPGRTQAINQHAVLRPPPAWDGQLLEKEGTESPEKSKVVVHAPHVGSSPASSPPMPPPTKPPPMSPPEVRALSTRGAHSPGAPSMRPTAVPAVQTSSAQTLLVRGNVHSASARSLGTARTPSPALERSAHSASARCLRTFEPRSASASTSRTVDVSHSPEPHSHSSRSPGPGDRGGAVGVARRAASPVMVTQPPAVPATSFLTSASSGCARSSRATWPTPAMNAQLQRTAVVSPQANLPASSGGSPRPPSGIVIHGPRRR